VDFASIERVVRAAFGQRRKTLSNALSGLLGAPAMRSAGVDPLSRAEQLPPAAFVALAAQLPAS
jgi:16S rRNA (adenine1518-N6/adenine1519-N6)-dimethyltransferase